MQDDIVLGGEKKSRFNWKVFGIIMTAVAVLALAFGIVMLVIKNNEAAKGGTSTGSNVAAGNPVVKAEPPALYTLGGTSSVFSMGEKEAVVSLAMENGAISECILNIVGPEGTENCQINGIEGEIYKVTKFDNIGENIRGLALIMTDGTVEYVQLTGAGPEFSVKGKLKIDGEVVDIMSAGVLTNEFDVEEARSYMTNLFILRSGKILEFDSAMLEGM